MKTITRLTLCYVFGNNTILLGEKKLRLGKGLLNGFGGHINRGESILAASKRKLLEESWIIGQEIKLIGVLDFLFQNEPNHIRRVFISRCDKFMKEPTPTEEMTPIWFSIYDIPYEKMWPSDKIFMPYLISGRKFLGTIIYDKKPSKESESKIMFCRPKEVKTLWGILIKDFVQSLFYTKQD